MVGAGPVGLWTALQLAERGVQVTIIDRESRTAARSYACALHSSTLRALQPFGLLPALCERGRRVSHVAFFDPSASRARLDLTTLSPEFPFLLILPQKDLEETLEHRLRQAGVQVHWNHRLDSFIEDQGHIVAEIEELGGTSTGYVVPHWESVVKRRAPLRAECLIGADGSHSMVRERLGVQWQRADLPQRFAAFEFETDSTNEDEVRVVLAEATTNVLWPLPHRRLRWTFQLTGPGTAEGLPEKERRAVRFEQPEIDEGIRQHVQRISSQRAPWFRANVRNLDWCSEVSFEPRVVSEFGRGRCWLVGDAAHQAGPVGVQSLNMGFVEAARLAELLPAVLREEAPSASLRIYDQEQRSAWRQLLGLTGGLQPGPQTDPWVAEHRAGILSCLPGLAGDLGALAGQLGLGFAEPAGQAAPAPNPARPMDAH